MAGDGTISGLICNNAKVPAVPTTAERMKPGFDLSMTYHSTGFTSARVDDTCSVDCQGSFLCTWQSVLSEQRASKTHDCESDPNKSADAAHHRGPISA